MHEYSALVLVELFTRILENVKSINFSFGLLFFHYFFTLCHRCYDVRCYGEGGVSDVLHLYDFHGKKFDGSFRC